MKMESPPSLTTLSTFTAYNNEHMATLLSAQTTLRVASYVRKTLSDIRGYRKETDHG